MNKNERMAKLNNLGVNTGNYFTLNLPEGIPAGAKIHVIIDENGVAVPVVNNDAILEQIIEDGYVRNTKLHRRFVMAQMFHMLNYVSWDKKYRGYNDCIKYRYSYGYTLEMMKEEVRVLSKLEYRDKETFDERATFFTKEVVVSVLYDYLEKLKEYIDKLPTKKCKGVPYKRIKGVNIFVEDLDKKMYGPIKTQIDSIRNSTSYTAMYTRMEKLMKNAIKLPYDTPKSKVWIDAYKGEGAYYTLKNLVMFHNCTIIDVRGIDYGMSSMAYLKDVLKEYKGEGWRMFALMNKVIKDNNFDYDRRMKELYN